LSLFFSCFVFVFFFFFSCLFDLLVSDVFLATQTPPPRTLHSFFLASASTDSYQMSFPPTGDAKGFLHPRVNEHFFLLKCFSSFCSTRVRAFPFIPLRNLCPPLLTAFPFVRPKLYSFRGKVWPSPLVWFVSLFPGLVSFVVPQNLLSSQIPVALLPLHLNSVQRAKPF